MVESPNLMKTSGDASIPAPRRHYRRSHAYGGPRGSGLVRRDHGWGLPIGRHPSWDKTRHSLGWSPIRHYKKKNGLVVQRTTKTCFIF